MIGQIRRLTHPVALAGTDARALAVYSEASPGGQHLPSVQRSAREAGLEGVACVDDAARAVVLYCAIWRRWKSEAVRAEALGLLRFLVYMQDPDGRFTNFIRDWTGRKNRSGRTSEAGGPPWQARAAHALACGIALRAGTEWGERLEFALRWLDEPLAYMDVRAVCVLATIEHYQATGSRRSAERALAWAAEIAACQKDGRLLDAGGMTDVHLWGHLQECALARVGRTLGRADLVQAARSSADSLLLPATAQLLTAPHRLPFDVSCLVAGLTEVARATGEPRFAEGAARARQWFQGRNAAGQAVYDSARSLFYDGVDNGMVSRNSGAESNIEGALALLASGPGQPAGYG